MPEMHHFRGKIPKYILTPLKKNGCHIFKIAIFSKFFGDVMNHIIRENAGEKIKRILVVFQLKTFNILLSVF